MTILAAEVTALFDPIMASIKEKLDILATENHLKGAVYDEVYSAALSNTLQQVVQLIIGTDQRALTAAKVLTEEQTKLNLIAEHDGIVAGTAKTDAERVKVEAETLLVPKNGALLDQQLLNAIEEKLEIRAKTANLNAELLNVPKQGALLDQQVLQSQGEVSLIPKRSQLMDAQITELVHRGQNLALEAIKLGLEGDNLKIQGDNLKIAGDIAAEELVIKKLEEKNVDAKRKEILTGAELQRANAKKATAELSSLYGQIELAKFQIMCDTYNTYASHTVGADIAFDTNSLAQAANQVSIAANSHTGTQLFF
jgi:hypothetical protein